MATNGYALIDAATGKVQSSLIPSSSPYAADAWDVNWQYSIDGDPTADTPAWTATGNNHGSDSQLGVSCWRVDGASGAASLALTLAEGLQTTGNWELRARVYQPTATNASSTTGSYVGFVLPFGTARRVLVIQPTVGGIAAWNSGGTTTLWFNGQGSNSPGPLTNAGWITITLRGVAQPAAGAATTAEVGIDAWLGSQYMGRIILTHAAFQNTGTAGTIIIGRTAGVPITYIDYVRYRKGHNEANPEYTLRGGGVDQP